MKTVELTEAPVEGHRYRALLSRPDLCAEIVAAIAEAIQDTREEMHPQLSPSVRGLHTYSHAMTNLGYATQDHGGRLVVVQGQPRIQFDQTDGLGTLDLALTRGTRTEDGFDTSVKGIATEQLIGIPQQAFDYDLPGVPMDDAAFIVYQKVSNPQNPGVTDVVVYLAHPARLNAKKTFLACDECIRLGRRSILPRDATPKVAAEPATPVVPQVAPHAQSEWRS